MAVFVRFFTGTLLSGMLECSLWDHTIRSYVYNHMYVLLQKIGKFEWWLLIIWFHNTGHFAWLSVLDTVGWWQEGHPACKKWRDGGGGHWLVRVEWRPAGWSVCVPLLIFPCTIKSRSSVLAQAHPGVPGKWAVKRLWCGILDILSASEAWAIWMIIRCWRG